jgi:predicted amidohydrolase YtcJ
LAEADLVISGRIASLHGRSGMGWVERLAVSGERIIASGTASDVEPLVGPRTRRLTLGPDEAVIPGLTDAHLHLEDVALAGDRVDLAGVDLETAVGRIRDADRGLGDPDAWLEGDGWDADRWGSWPGASLLEATAPGRRAAFWAHDRHALWVSERALVEAGVDAGTSDPPGGLIRRDPSGRPSGILHETAAGLVLARIPRASVERRIAAVARLLPRLLAVGLVAAHDPGSLIAEADLTAQAVYRTLDERGWLAIDVHASVRREGLPAAIAAGMRTGDLLAPDLPAGGVRARFGWLKLFADGTLGSRTAAMLAPFQAGPDGAADEGRGLFQIDPGELAELVAEAAAAGIVAQVHAIGDAAVRATLDALGSTGGGSRPAPRVEHAQLVDPSDLGRFRSLGVVASVQPVHLGTDAPAARAAWGDRADRAYPYRSIMEAGGDLAFGTDAPVEPWDPWPGLEQAVTRRAAWWPGDRPTLGPSEGIDLATALRAATIGPALAAGLADRGRLVAGQRADLLVVPAGVLATPVVPGGPLGLARPRLVLVGGRVVAEAGATPSQPGAAPS